MTIREALFQGISKLKKAGIEEFQLEAEILLAHSLDKDRIWLHLNPDLPIEASAFLELIRKRASRIPLHYIMGRREFWSMEFKVNHSTLIPRPETEILVETALDILRDEQIRSPLILDLGTGSGCIAIALLKENPGARAVVTDLSFMALKTAMDNASVHDVRKRIYPVAADWLEPFATGESPFDMVVSNPPYIAEEQAGTLPPEILGHEPRNALFAGRDGMAQVKKLLSSVPGVLKRGRWFLCEIGWDQGQIAIEAAEKTKAYNEIKILQDLGGKDRILAART